MALTEAFSGTETIGVTEWSLTTDTAGPDVETSDGVVQIVLDANTVAASDVFECRLYEKCLSTGTQRLADSFAIAGPQGKPIHYTPAVALLHGWDVTLVKISGTDRSFDWSIRKAT